MADLTLEVEAFLNGDLTILPSVPDDRKDEVRQLGADGLAQLYETPAGTVRFIALNPADPTNPQPAFDEAGNVIDQGFHPILGDLRVRQALMYAMDFESMNLAVFNGEGVQLSTHWLPTNWAYNAEAVPFYPYDMTMADQLLTEAGWVDADGDPSTVRVCQGCLYAEEGTEMQLNLITNSGNTENENLGLVLTDQWAQAGIGITFTPIEFGTLVEELQAQTFDMVMIFWGFGVPADPTGDMRVNFDPANDLPGAGFNVTSMNNPRLNEILTMGNDPAQTNSCDTATRAEMYLEAYQILRDEVPWIWVETSMVLEAVQPGVENWSPRIGSGASLWNVDGWIVP
jgi:peptide/nickel transport system substrate-binding protein